MGGKEIGEKLNCQSPSLEPAYMLSEAIDNLLKSRSEREMVSTEVPNVSQDSDSSEVKRKKKKRKKGKDKKKRKGKEERSRREKTLTWDLKRLGKKDLEKIISEGDKWDVLFKPKNWKIISKSVSKKKKVKVKKIKKIVERIHNDESSNIEDKKIYLECLHESLQDMLTKDKKSPKEGKKHKKKKKHKTKRGSSEDEERLYVQENGEGMPKSMEEIGEGSLKRHCYSGVGDIPLGKLKEGDENGNTTYNKTENSMCKTMSSGKNRSSSHRRYSSDGNRNDKNLSRSPSDKDIQDEMNVRRRPKDENLCSSLKSSAIGDREVWSKRDGKIRIQVSNKKKGGKPSCSREKLPFSSTSRTDQLLSPANAKERLGPLPSH